MLAKEIVERAQSTYLNAGGVNIPKYDTLTSALNATDKTFALDGRMKVPPDSILEFDDPTMEMALNQTTSGSTVSVNERGYLESTAAEHAAGTRVLLNNPWPKIVLFNTLRALITSLYGYGLFRRVIDSVRTYTTTQVLVLDPLDRDVSSVRYRWSGQWRNIPHTDYEVVHEATPIEIQFFGGAPEGSQLRLATKRNFTLPTSLTDDLDGLGISESLQPSLSLGVASMVLTGQEVPEVQAEHIRRSLANAGTPVGSRANVAQALWEKFMLQVSLERRRLTEATPTVIAHRA